MVRFHTAEIVGRISFDLHACLVPVSRDVEKQDTVRRQFLEGRCRERVHLSKCWLVEKVLMRIGTRWTFVVVQVLKDSIVLQRKLCASNGFSTGAERSVMCRYSIRYYSSLNQLHQ